MFVNEDLWNYWDCLVNVQLAIEAGSVSPFDFFEELAACGPGFGSRVAAAGEQSREEFNARLRAYYARAQRSGGSSLVIAPNPARQQAEARFSLPSPDKVTIQIRDSKGTLVRTLPETELPGGRHRLELPVAGLAPGLYLVQLHGSRLSATTRLIVAP